MQQIIDSMGRHACTTGIYALTYEKTYIFKSSQAATTYLRNGHIQLFKYVSKSTTTLIIPWPLVLRRRLKYSFKNSLLYYIYSYLYFRLFLLELTTLSVCPSVCIVEWFVFLSVSIHILLLWRKTNFANNHEIYQPCNHPFCSCTFPPTFNILD